MIDLAKISDLLTSSSENREMDRIMQIISATSEHISISESKCYDHWGKVDMALIAKSVARDIDGKDARIAELEEMLGKLLTYTDSLENAIDRAVSDCYEVYEDVPQEAQLDIELSEIAELLAKGGE